MSRASYMPGSGFYGRTNFLHRRDDLQTEISSASGAVLPGSFNEVGFGPDSFSPDYQASRTLVQLQNSDTSIIEDPRIRFQNNNPLVAIYVLAWRSMEPVS